MCVLGWDNDTVATTISVSLEKLERLRDTLHEWSPDRVVASEKELRSLIGRLSVSYTHLTLPTIYSV